MKIPSREEIYCLRSRARTATSESHQVVLKNGRAAMFGRCATCGARKFRIGVSGQEPERGGHLAQFLSKLPRRTR